MSNKQLQSVPKDGSGRPREGGSSPRGPRQSWQDGLRVARGKDVTGGVPRGVSLSSPARGGSLTSPHGTRGGSLNSPNGVMPREGSPSPRLGGQVGAASHSSQAGPRRLAGPPPTSGGSLRLPQHR